MPFASLKLPPSLLPLHSLYQFLFPMSPAPCTHTPVDLSNSHLASFLFTLLSTSPSPSFYLLASSSSPACVSCITTLCRLFILNFSCQTYSWSPSLTHSTKLCCASLSRSSVAYPSFDLVLSTHFFLLFLLVMVFLSPFSLFLPSIHFLAPSPHTPSLLICLSLTTL